MAIEHGADGARDEERHREQAEVWPVVGAVTEPRRQACRARGRPPGRQRHGQGESGEPRRCQPAPSGPATEKVAHTTYTARYRSGHRPTTKCQYMAHARSGTDRSGVKRPRAASATEAMSQSRAPRTWTAWVPMSV